MCVWVCILLFLLAVLHYIILYISSPSRPHPTPILFYPILPQLLSPAKNAWAGTRGGLGSLRDPKQGSLRSLDPIHPIPSYPILSHSVPFRSLLGPHPYPIGPGAHMAAAGGSVHSTSLPPSVRPPGPKNIMYS